MKFCFSFLVCLAVASNALAQTSVDEAKSKTVVSETTLSETTLSEATAASTTPVAYVYVSRPTHIDGFAAASDGRLTAVPGSPFSNISVDHMSVTPKFLFGVDASNSDIYTFSIAATGALKNVATINTKAYDPEGGFVGFTQTDFSKSTLYNYVLNGDSYVQAYQIEGSGALKYQSTTETDEHFDTDEVVPTMISFLGNNKFAYETGCDPDQIQAATDGFERSSNGDLGFVSINDNMPADRSGYMYCPVAEATDSSDHIAFAMQDFNVNDQMPERPNVLATYTAGSTGKLTTTSSYSNMPTTDVNQVYTMSISPSGKLLAVGGYKGFQLFHFDGSNPITKDTGLLQSSLSVVQFGWDDANHLYVLSTDALRVYTVTPTSVTEGPGSPISIPEASSLIVLSPK